VLEGAEIESEGDRNEVSAPLFKGIRTSIMKFLKSFVP